MPDNPIPKDPYADGWDAQRRGDSLKTCPVYMTLMEMSDKSHRWVKDQEKVKLWYTGYVTSLEDHDQQPVPQTMKFRKSFVDES